MTDRRILVLRTALIWLFLELAAAAQVRSPGGELVLWRWARAAVSPVLWVSESIGTVVGDAVNGVTDSASLVMENRRLKIELEAARARSLVLLEDMASQLELAPLVAMLPHLEATVVPARTTYRDLERGRMIVRVGTDHRVSEDSSAVASGGVIGRVIHSQGRRCWIELITHPVAAVAVQTRDGSVRGLAVGSDSAGLEIQFVPRQAQLLRGEELVTSGADGIHPPGLPVGRVVSVRESDQPFLEIRAEPSASLATARVVLLLDGWASPIDEELLSP